MPRFVPRYRTFTVGSNGHFRPVCHAHLSHMSESTSNPEPLSHTPMWTLDELCAKVHATRRMVHHWRQAGNAPKAYKVGKHLLFDEADVRAWLEARQTTMPTDVERRADETGW